MANSSLIFNGNNVCRKIEYHITIYPLMSTPVVTNPLAKFPKVLQRIITDYIDDAARLHLWAASARHGHDWKWVRTHIPAIDSGATPGYNDSPISFYSLFRTERDEVICQIGEPYPEAINILIYKKSVAAIYDKFYNLEDGPEFYTQVAYAMLCTASEVFPPRNDRGVSISNLFEGLACPLSDLWDQLLHSKPHVHMRMLECLLSACGRYKIGFYELRHINMIIKRILGIGAVNDVDQNWYRDCLNILNIPPRWRPYPSREFRDYALHGFPTNRTLNTFVNTYWSA